MLRCLLYCYVVLRVHKVVRRSTPVTCSGSASASLARLFPYRKHGPLTISREAKGTKIVPVGLSVGGDAASVAVAGDGGSDSEEGRPRSSKKLARSAGAQPKKKKQKQLSEKRRLETKCNVCGETLKNGVTPQHLDSARCKRKGAAAQRAGLAGGNITVQLVADVDAKAAVAASVARHGAAAQPAAQSGSAAPALRVPKTNFKQTPSRVAAVSVPVQSTREQSRSRTADPTGRKRTNRELDDDEFD